MSKWCQFGVNCSESQPEYLEKNDVEKHDGAHNLKSSWILCANLYFSFQRAPEMLARFLKEKLSLPINSVDKIELEYAEKPPLDPQNLLGEPDSGKRGRNQTSPDIAFIVNEGTGLILTENKYTEHSFYECSGRKYSPHPKKCLDINSILDELDSTCYQLNWEEDGRPNRKYWNYLKISDYGKSILRRCPAAYSGSQLFRQQALAEAISQSGKYDFVISCVAYDDNNDALIKCLQPAGLVKFSDWGRIFDGKAEFTTFTHQQWVEWVKQKDCSGKWNNWLNYIQKRYGYPPSNS